MAQIAIICPVPKVVPYTRCYLTLGIPSGSRFPLAPFTGLDSSHAKDPASSSIADLSEADLTMLSLLLNVLKTQRSKETIIFRKGKDM